MPTPTSSPQARPAQALALACRALWLATLSLMSAALLCDDPAERRALARRIARNFETLAREGDCFTPSCRDSFSRLAARWSRIAAARDGSRRATLH